MIKRQALDDILILLQEFPAVGILGPRQVGKTTLADTIAALIKPEPVYLDLERPSARARINDPEEYFEIQKNKLIILDEIQRVPDLFQVYAALSIKGAGKEADRSNSLFWALLPLNY